MKESEITDAQRAARDAFDAFLQEHAPEIGPNQDGEGQPGTWMPTEWVIVTSWTCMEDGDSFLSRWWSKDLLDHHRSGLLHEALFNWGDGE